MMDLFYYVIMIEFNYDGLFYYVITNYDRV